MSLTYQIIRGCLILAVFAAATGWFIWRWLKNTDDPALLIFRWGLTLLILGGLAYSGANGQKQ